jgi:hypothetical protein
VYRVVLVDAKIQERTVAPCEELARLRILNADRAVIEPAKLHDYLLSRGILSADSRPRSSWRSATRQRGGASWRAIYEISIFRTTQPQRRQLAMGRSMQSALRWLGRLGSPRRS